MKIEPNHIYLGDCLDLMSHIEDASIDMILCDLPYGTTDCSWDIKIPLESLWEQYKCIIKIDGAIVLTASQPFTSILVMSNLEMFKYEIIWEKEQATNFMMLEKQIGKIHENILIFYNQMSSFNPIMIEGKPPIKSGSEHVIEVMNNFRGVKSKRIGKTDRFPCSILKIKRDSDRAGLHPTQKPVALFEYLIKTYTNEGDLVLDNCIGSGTTAIAALNTNRRYIGMEKEQEYYDKAVYRVNHRQTKLT